MFGMTHIEFEKLTQCSRGDICQLKFMNLIQEKNVCVAQKI